MKKKRKTYFLKESNIIAIEKLAKSKTRKIGDTLDLIIESHFKKSNTNEKEN